MKKFLFLLILALVYTSCAPGNQSSTNASESVSEAQETATDPIMVQGENVYRQYCLTCHQEDGYGVPKLNPPLAGVEWVTGDKTRLITVILQGLQGEIEIDDEVYDNVMAPHAFLSDEDVAAVSTYIRNSFGNNASKISPEEVAAARAALGS